MMAHWSRGDSHVDLMVNLLYLKSGRSWIRPSTVQCSAACCWRYCSHYSTERVTPPSFFFQEQVSMRQLRDSLAKRIIHFLESTPVLLAPKRRNKGVIQNSLNSKIPLKQNAIFERFRTNFVAKQEWLIAEMLIHVWSVTDRKCVFRTVNVMYAITSEIRNVVTLGLTLTAIQHVLDKTAKTELHFLVKVQHKKLRFHIGHIVSDSEPNWKTSQWART